MANWFANPAALWAALLFGPLLLLYMLRHRPVRRRVPSVVLWTGVAQSQIATSPFQRLRRSLSLLLMLIALTCLILALAGLRVPGGEARGLPITLVIDVTAGMSAADAGGTRITTARRRAESVIEAAGNSSISLFVWDGNLRSLTPADSEPAVALRALDRVTATQVGATDASLARALDGLASNAGRRVVLISDHAPGDVPGVLFVPAGISMVNAAIVSASLSEITATQVDLFFGIELFGADNPLRVPLVLERVDGDRSELMDARDVDLQPGRRASVTFSGMKPGLYAATLKLEDALAIDNVAWLRFSELPVQDVVFTGEAPPVLLRAAEAVAEGMGLIRIVRHGDEDGETASYVLADAASAGAQPRLPSVFLAPLASPPGAVFGPAEAIADAATRPVPGFLWRGAGTPDVRVPSMLPLQTDRRLLPVLEAGTGAAINLLPRDDGLHDLAVGVVLDESAVGFTGQHAFLIFWANWFDYVRRSREPLPRGAVTTRDGVRVPSFAARGEFTVKGSDDAWTATATRPLHFDTIGLYSLEGLATNLPELGVSLLDPAESDTGAAAGYAYDEEAMREWLLTREGEGERRDLPLRTWLALLAAALLLFDWFWFRRKFPMQAEGQSPRSKTLTAVRAKRPRNARGRV
jgi:hypothetical protein